MQSHASSRGIYGYRKVYKDVVEDYGHACCEETVRTIMREKGLQASQKRRFVVTTDSDHTMPVAENLLNRDFQPDRPNQKWVAASPASRTMRAGCTCRQSWTSLDGGL